MSNPPKSQFFLFLEIRDPDFNAFYDDTVRLLTGAAPTKVPHLTIRGPHKQRLKKSQIDGFEAVMRHAVLEIGGLGCFSNPRETVVYLSVDSPQLREIWWKPDFPLGSFGFNPHLSLYRGSDEALAKRLLRFEPLREARFLCAEFDLVSSIRDAAQRELKFPSFSRASDHRRFKDSNAIPPDFFVRLRELVEGTDNRHHR